MGQQNFGRKYLGTRPKVFAAITTEATKEVSYALGDGVDLILASTFAEAEQSLEKQDAIELYIVSYHFDEMRPFRFIQLVKSNPAYSHIPMVLVHALPLHYPTPEVGAMREAYASLGVTDVISLLTLTRDYGRDRAVEIFRERIAAILKR